METHVRVTFDERSGELKEVELPKDVEKPVPALTPEELERVERTVNPGGYL